MSQPPSADPHPTAELPIYAPDEPTRWAASARPAPPVAMAEHHDPPVGPRRRGPGVWIAIVAVAVALCAGFAGGVLLVVRVQPGSTTASPSVSPSPTRDNRTVALESPAKLAGYSKISNLLTYAWSAKVESDLIAQFPAAEQAVSGSYGDVLQGQLRLLAAVKQPVADPAKEMTRVVRLMTPSSSFGLREVVTVPAGPLGGTARCGRGSSSGLPFAICLWVDEGSVGTVFFLNQSVSEVKETFLQARTDAEDRA